MPPHRGPEVGGPRLRDLRGRGVRGPWAVPGPLTPRGVPRRATARKRFDELVLDVVAGWNEELAEPLERVEFAVEDVPAIPPDWSTRTVPLSAVGRMPDGTARVVIFRRPVEQRAVGRDELVALVQTVLVEQVADLLGVSAEEIDPGYRPE